MVLIEKADVALGRKLRTLFEKIRPPVGGGKRERKREAKDIESKGVREGSEKLRERERGREGK